MPRRPSLVAALLVALAPACDPKPAEPGTTTAADPVGTNTPPEPTPAGPQPEPPSPEALAAAIPSEPPPMQFWTLGEQACPPGGKLDGGLPPAAHEIRCVTSEGRWTGPEARFHPGDEPRVQSIGRKRDGKSVGLWWWFHADGSKAAEHPYVEGELHGTLRRWAANGQEIELGEYRVGRPWGLFVVRDESGIELSRAQLVDGTGTLVRQSERGRQESEHVAGLLHGTHREYDEAGRLRQESHWSGGELHGLEVTWDADGNKLTERHWLAGLRDGVESRWQGGVLIERSVWVAGTERTRQLIREDQPLAPLPEPTACDTNPGLSEALQAARGRGLDDHHACVDRDPLFPGVVRVGDFAHDAGCMGGEWLLDCKLAAQPPSAATLLGRAGWAQASGEQRIELATRYWASFGLASGFSVSAAPEPASWTLGPDGGVEALLWVAHPTGMIPERRLDQLRLRFAADGGLTQETLDHRVERL